MVSPAKAHFLRVSAAALAVAGQPVNQVNASQYELMLAKLAEDLRRLKDVQSIERRAEVKRQLLPEYQPWVEGVLQGDSGQQDDVLMTVMVWQIDIGDLDAALPIARYAIAHNLVMPDRYKRDVPTLLAEEFADIAIKSDSAASVVPLLVIGDLTADKDMPDEVRAKLFKAIGYCQRSAAEAAPEDERRPLLESAKQYLERALALHDKCGVKKDIERLETAIKNSAGT